MKRIPTSVVLLSLVFLILGNSYITGESQLNISAPSRNLGTPIPTSTLTDDQHSFAPPILLAPFLALPLVVIGICCTMLLLVGVFILTSTRHNRH